MVEFLYKPEDLGAPKFILKIEIQCRQKTFRDKKPESASSQIERLGLAIHRAKKIFGGIWKVTERGYLLQGFFPGLEEQRAVLEVDDAFAGIELLEKVLKGEARVEEGHKLPEIHYDNGAPSSRVSADKNGLFLI